MGSFLSLYAVYILIRLANKYLDKDSYKYVENPYAQEKRLENYYPLFFHITISLLILFSSFSPGLLDSQRIHALVNDGFFQFMSTALILFISMINPFVSFSPESRAKLESWPVKDKFLVNWLLNGRNWQLLKLGICLVIVAYFIYNEYLILPDLNQGIVSDVAMVLIFIFIFGNVIQLIRNPQIFKQKTLFRLSMLYKSIKRSLIISAIIVALIHIFYFIMKPVKQDLVNIEGIALLVYNMIMAYNEYKVLNAKSVPINDTSLAI